MVSGIESRLRRNNVSEFRVFPNYSGLLNPNITSNKGNFRIHNDRILHLPYKTFHSRFYTKSYLDLNVTTKKAWIYTSHGTGSIFLSLLGVRVQINYSVRLYNSFRRSDWVYLYLWRLSTITSDAGFRNYTEKHSL